MAFNPDWLNGNVMREQGDVVMTPDNAIRQSAREVVDRLGAAAIEYMHDRIAGFELDGTPQERDQAYRLLTAVEDISREREP
jgi:hypothetical protein